MPQALGVSDVIARRTDAAVALFRGTTGAGGLDARAVTATRSRRPRRVATFMGANQTATLLGGASTDSGSLTKSVAAAVLRVREHPSPAEPTS